MNESIEQLKEIIDKSDNIVFFGGAGVSTESGVPDFRSVDGLYNQEYKYPPETILSHTFYKRNPEEFFRFYRNKMLFPNAEPNNAHKALAKLEEMGKLKAVITQNIDGLHQKAGSKNVLEIHGTTYKNHCIKCGKEYSAEYVFNGDDVPRCSCGGIIKPDVILYGEMLPEEYSLAVSYIYKAETLIVVGTSLTVEPACGLVKLFNGKNLVIINDTLTQYDDLATLVIHEKMEDVIKKIKGDVDDGKI